MASQRNSGFIPLPPTCNILQPKRLNLNILNNCPEPRRVLGQKALIPIPLSQLSNQQLTSLLRNSPLITPTVIAGDSNNNTNGANTVSGDICNPNTNNLLPTPISSGTKRAATTMAKRNARERNRVKQVNTGFQTLRQHIPDGYRMKKMSKVDTLRCALEYIRNLERILQDDDNEEGGNNDNGIGIVQSSSGGIDIKILTESPTNSESSRSVSYSSEEEYLVQAFSSDFSPTPEGEGMIRIRDQFVSSATSILYNDENQDESLENVGVDANAINPDGDREQALISLLPNHQDQKVADGYKDIEIEIETEDSFSHVENVPPVQ